MVIVMHTNAKKDEINNVSGLLKRLGLGVHISEGAERTIIGVIGDKRILSDTPIELLDGVDKIIHIMESFKLVGRTFKPDSTIIRINDIEIGGKGIVVIAGPCAVENREQLLITAQEVKKAGAHILRGGAFKPRTSPYSFQGLEEDGLKILAEARDLTGMPIISEIISIQSLELALNYVDIVQIGARNMQNFQLLREVGRINKPVMLKRGLSATIEEWLNAAEYIMSEGNYEIILCERGIRTFENYTRNTLDLSAVPIIKNISHLPVMVDPSHGTGKLKLIKPMSMAAIAAGADGLMIEAHYAPENALSDGPQSLTPEKLSSLILQIKKLAKIMEREF